MILISITCILLFCMHDSDGNGTCHLTVSAPHTFANKEEGHVWIIIRRPYVDINPKSERKGDATKTLSFILLVVIS